MTHVLYTVILIYLMGNKFISSRQNVIAFFSKLAIKGHVDNDSNFAKPFFFTVNCNTDIH